MKLKIKNQTIASAAKRLYKVIDAKSPLSVMQNYHIVIVEDSMTITAMNARCTVRERLNIQSDIHEEMQIAVDAKKLSSIVQKLYGDIVIDIDIKNKSFKIKYESGNIKLPYEDVRTFPAIFTPTQYKSFKIDGDDLYGLLDCVGTIVEENQLRPTIGNILIELNSNTNKLNVVGMNTAEGRFCSMDMECNDDVSMLISPKFYGILKPYVKGKEVEVRYDGKRTYIVTGDSYLYDINAEGHYANYNLLISRCSGPSMIRVDRELLIEKLERISVTGSTLFNICVNEDSSYIKNDLTDNDVELKEELETIDKKGEFDDNYNVEKAIKLLSNLQSSEVDICKSEAIRCIYVKENLKNTQKIFLLMSYIIA